MHWQKYPERDVIGYRVYRDTIDAAHLVCDTKKTSCTDANPGTVGSTHHYYVVALDCTSLYGSCTSREGTPFDLPVTLTAGLSLVPPVGLSATITDGLPVLTWTPVPGASFYRIYRDTGTGLSDRYDETINSSATYTDPNPGDHTNHTYWVTAVNSGFNESPPSQAITAP
jgi:fibronectin type 3 domain-containing protein